MSVRVTFRTELDWQEIFRFLSQLWVSPPHPPCSGGDSPCAPPLCSEPLLASLSLRDLRALACVSKTAALAVRAYVSCPSLAVSEADATLSNAMFVARLAELQTLRVGDASIAVAELRAASRVRLPDGFGAAAALFLGAILATGDATLRLTGGTRLRNVRDLRKPVVGGQSAAQHAALTRSDKALLFVASCLGKGEPTEMCEATIHAWLPRSRRFVAARCAFRPEAPPPKSLRPIVKKRLELA